MFGGIFVVHVCVLVGTYMGRKYHQDIWRKRKISGDVREVIIKREFQGGIFHQLTKFYEWSGTSKHQDKQRAFSQFCFSGLAKLSDRNL